MIGQNPYNNRTKPLEELKNFFKKKDVLSRLIIVNIILFTIINVLALILFLFNIDQEFVLNNGVSRVTYYLSLPSDILSIFARPWTLITYMFVQEDVFHLFFNMLVLYVGGRIFNQFVGESKMLSVYMISGFVGAIMYILTFNIFPAFGNIVASSFAIGASASVLGIFIAAATYVPNLQLNMILLGNVKLKYIAIIFIALDLLNMRAGNAGGHIAHIGGALYGFFFITQLKKNIDYSLYFNKVSLSFQSFFFRDKKKNNPFQKVHKNTTRSSVSDDDYLKNKKEKQVAVDAILDKIKKSGYDSLSTKEKQMLFQASKEE